MPTINTIKPLGSEGTIKFKLTPIQNGTNRLYLIDAGAEKGKNRITLLVTKSGGVRSLTLEVLNNVGKMITASREFPSFQLGSAFSVELVWSSDQHIVAVYIDDADDEFLKVSGDEVIIEGLGNLIHSGEDMEGNNKTEMLTSG